MTRTLELVVIIAVIVALAPPTYAETNCWMDGRTVVYSDQPPPEGAVITAMPRPEPLPVVRASDAAAGDAPANADEILALSGSRAQLPAIARSLGAEYLTRLGKLDDRDTARAAQIIARHFAPERMYAAARDEFRRRIDNSQLDAMAVWFRSPLALKITALEIAASEPDAAPRIAGFVAGLKVSPPTVARAELAQRLDWVTGTSEDTTDLSLAIVGSVERAASAAAPADRRPRARLVERGVEEMRDRMTGVVRENVVGQMLYIYAPLTDAELKAYVDFSASPAGRMFGRSVHGALIRVVRDVADRTATDIVRAVPPERWVTAQPSARSATR
jgi:hypothetical protein